MCGSYSIVPGDKFYQRFAPVNRLVVLKPNYNVKPGYMMPVVSGNMLSLMKWVLIPSWAKDPSIGYKLEAYPVSRAVNYGRNNSEELIKPVKTEKK